MVGPSGCDTRPVVEQTPTVAVIGLGLMGRPFVRVLTAAGLDVVGSNRSKLDPELVEGITLVSLEDAANRDVLLLMLSDSPATDQVLGRLEPRLARGQVVLDMGSSDPRRSIEHAERLADQGIGWIDAPVSGGPEGAAAGSLAIMAGGTATDVAVVTPVLAALGGSVVHVGGAGAGHTSKLVNQLICGLAIEAVGEGLTLAEKAGLDPTLVQQALAGGFADSKVLQLHGTRMIARDYTAGGKARTHLKDLRMVQGLAADLGLTLPHTDDVAARYEQLVERGEGDLDHSALHKLLWDTPRAPATT